MIAEVRENGSRRRHALFPEPSGAAEIQHLCPASERRLRCMQCGKRSRLFCNNRGGVVWLACQRKAGADRVLEDRRRVHLEEWERDRSALAPITARGLTSHVLEAGADQAVARDQVMVEKGERLVGREGREPQRQ